MKNKFMCNKGFADLDLDFSDVDDYIGGANLPDPILLEYYRGLRKREILWNSDVASNMMEVAMYIQKWNVEDKGIPVEERKPIKIFINTDGGCANTIMHIIDTIKLSKTPVITIGMGKAYSAGGLLLMAGHKRYIFKHTTCLLHDGSSGAYGDTGKLMDNLRFTEKFESMVRDYVIASTKITPEMYDQNYRRDWWMFSDEIIEYGVADEIITDIDVIL